jgi:HEAT repeat protein
MIDRTDPTTSMLAFILLRALKAYADDEVLNLLADRDELIRHAVATEVHTRPRKPVFDAVCKLSNSIRHEHRQACAHALSQFGLTDLTFVSPSLPILVALMDDPYEEVRAEAATALGWIATRGGDVSHALAKLFALEKDKSETVRSSLATSLLSIRTTEATELAQRLTDDKSASVRNAAEFVLENR